MAADGAVVAPTLGAKTPPPTTDTFTDFAYQAMENLAFQSLDATINSLPRAGSACCSTSRARTPRRPTRRSG
uniref:Uncharacterized protein n=1 Tax=Phenylobacterium glaciei TaxID=2803784 RepID=A0A974S7Q8_9CAUL|nr:hypothetical protein JKL49_27420 [Phenylobacterium glaciei]